MLLALTPAVVLLGLARQPTVAFVCAARNYGNYGGEFRSLDERARPPTHGHPYGAKT